MPLQLSMVRLLLALFYFVCNFSCIRARNDLLDDAGQGAGRKFTELLLALESPSAFMPAARWQQPSAARTMQRKLGFRAPFVNMEEVGAQSMKNTDDEIAALEKKLEEIRAATPEGDQFQVDVTPGSDFEWPEMRPIEELPEEKIEFEGTGLDGKEFDPRLIFYVALPIAGSLVQIFFQVSRDYMNEWMGLTPGPADMTLEPPPLFR